MLRTAEISFITKIVLCGVANEFFLILEPCVSSLAKTVSANDKNDIKSPVINQTFDGTVLFVVNPNDF